MNSFINSNYGIISISIVLFLLILFIGLFLKRIIKQYQIILHFQKRICEPINFYFPPYNENEIVEDKFIAFLSYLVLFNNKLNIESPYRFFSLKYTVPIDKTYLLSKKIVLNVLKLEDRLGKQITYHDLNIFNQKYLKLEINKQDFRYLLDMPIQIENNTYIYNCYGKDLTEIKTTTYHYIKIKRKNIVLSNENSTYKNSYDLLKQALIENYNVQIEWCSMDNPKNIKNYFVSLNKEIS